WYNVLNYFDITNSVSEELSSFLNNKANFIPLSEDKLDDGLFASRAEMYSFAKNFLLENSIGDEAIKRLINSFTVSLEDIGETSVSEHRISILIQHNIIALNLINFGILRKKYTPHQCILIERNKDLFFENFESYNLNAAEYLFVLNSPVFSLVERDRLIASVNPPILEKDSILVKLLISDIVLRRIKMPFVLLQYLFHHTPDNEVRINILCL